MNNYLAFCLILPLVILGQSNETGSCVTGPILFDPIRSLALAVSVEFPEIDVSTYDFSIDYGYNNSRLSNDSLYLSLQRNGNSGATGVRASTSRYFLYGKASVKITVPTIPGVVTSFITMSDRGDEIDFEFAGINKNSIDTNVFYKGIPEYSEHAAWPNVTNVAAEHLYEIDWRSDMILWLVDGKEVRRLLRENSTSTRIPSNERWFPSTPSRVQLGIWDAGSSADAGTSSWAGGKINWLALNTTKITAKFRDFKIQCYDAQNQPVPKWPNDPSNPDYQTAPSAQPTILYNPTKKGPLVVVGENIRRNQGFHLHLESIVLGALISVFVLISSPLIL